jgi:PAS domain S-box-containing protein
MKASVEKKVVLGFVASVVALLGISLLSYRTIENSINAQAWVTHTYEVMATLEQGHATLTDAETAQRAYLLTGQERFFLDSSNAQGRLNGWLENVRALTADNLEQHNRLNELQPLILQRLTLLNQRMELRREQGLQAAAKAVASGEGADLSLQIMQRIEAMRTTEIQLLQARQQTQSAYAGTAEAFVICGGLLACVLGLIAILQIHRDFKEQKRITALLEHERHLLNQLMDNAIEDIYFKDRESHFLRVNRHSVNRFGLDDPAKVIGKTDADFFSGKHAQQALRDEQEIMRTGQPMTKEEQEIWPDGHVTWVMTLKSPWRDPAGNVVGTFGLTRDITERKRAEEELDRFFALSLDFLCIASADGYMKRVSPAVTDILGWSIEEFQSRPYINFVHPDDHAATLREVERQVVAGEKVLRFENRYQHKDGSWRVLSWRSIPQPGGLMYATARDITEQKAWEAELRRSRAVFENLFVSLPGLYLVLTPDLKIVAVSDAYLKATMTQREKIIGCGLFEVFPDNPNDPKATGVSNLRASLNRVLQKAEPDTMAIQKYDVRCPDGAFEERFWSPVNSPVLGDNRRIEYIIHRVEDVTGFVKRQQRQTTGDENGIRVEMQRMEAEIFRSSEEVRAANEKLHAANKELEAFSYSVSHDLRAPLRHIDGFVKLLDKSASSSLDERSRRYLDIIADSAHRMGALIDDLLVFSRMGRAELHHAKVDSNALIHEVRDSIQGDTQGRNIEWAIAALPQVQADAPMMRQVWANLVGNAVKYSRPRDPARIEIGCHENGKEFIFHVADNGVGFDMQYAHKLFGVFQRLHSTEEFEGTGIGLANVQRIVLRHHGRVWAESRLNEGSTFYFAIPKTNQ